MRAELYRPDEPERVVAVATWAPGTSHLEVLDPSIGGLDRVLRRTPVVVEEASLRPLGSHGEVLLHPGSFEWFRSALIGRAAELGLAVRFVRERVEGGWDPAAAYRTFDEQRDRLVSS